MTDQTIPADKVREIIHVNTFRRVVMPHCRASIIDQLEALLSLHSLPTLADMPLGEQDECTGMQADLAQGDRVVVLDGTPDHDGLVQVLEKSLDVYSTSPENVTPRPDLPRLEWPSEREDDQ